MAIWNGPACIVLECGAIFTLLMPAVATVLGTAPETRPHIIMAMIDDLGWNGLPLHGNNDEVKAPFIQSLADDGIMLENYYAYPYCAPSRAAFLTGRVPGHGIWEENPTESTAVGVNLNMDMIPAMLKRAGYVSHQIGKWHQGYHTPAFLPIARGFDTSFGYLMGGQDHFTSCQACANNLKGVNVRAGPESCGGGHCGVQCPEEGGVDLWRDDHPAIGENGTEYTAWLWMKEALHRIEENDGTPMFMYLALSTVHQPVEAPPELLDEFSEEDYPGDASDRRYYNAMHLSVEKVMKNVVGALKDKGMYERTVIVFSSDNGGTFEHWGAVAGSSNYPLRGHKYSYFQGGIRATAFVHSPLLPKEVRGIKSQTLFHITDWYVTFCNLAGLEDCDDGHSKHAPLDGVDVWPLLQQGEKAHRPASRWAETGGPERNEVLIGVGQQLTGALIQRHYKLIMGSGTAGSDGWSAQYPGTTERWPSPENEACRAKPCLFNIKDDPSEEHDLADEEPEMLQMLVTRFKSLTRQMDKPNGGDNLLKLLVWNGAYHVPPFEDTAACQAMRKTGFFGPWQELSVNPWSRYMHQMEVPSVTLTRTIHEQDALGDPRRSDGQPGFAESSTLTGAMPMHGPTDQEQLGMPLPGVPTLFGSFSEKGARSVGSAGKQFLSWDS